MMRASRQGLLMLALLLAGCRHAVPNQRLDRVLSGLRDEINSQYGFRDETPRINLGPCGRFAKTFREEWNARFADKINIAFIMSQDDSMCHHVLVRLPDGRYFDGGNGVVPEQKLVSLYTNSHVEVMKEFDFALLDRRSYGLRRSYPVCPNYSDDATAQIIRRHLDKLCNG